MNKLLSGHDTLEFGWLLMAWIPAMRRYVKENNPDEVIVVCRTGNEYLYQDFATKFECFDKKGRVGLYPWTFRDKPIKMPKKLICKYRNAVVIAPEKKVLYKWPREYVRYGTRADDLSYDIVIHARSEAKFDRGNRNWPIGKYLKVIRKLRNDRDVSICSIGSKKGAYHIPGTEDMRGVSMEKLCNTLRSSKLCIGPSSGPIHLASLCGCPHIVWTDNKVQKAIKGTNRDRYEKLWKPFNVKVSVIDQFGWLPPWKVVYGEVRRCL